VAIDPATGAAEDRALYTYEAIPRGTVLCFSVVYHNPRHYMFPVWKKDENNGERIEPTAFPEAQDAAWVEERVVEGLRLMEHLGIGGMSTRGFGRLQVLGLPEPVGEGG